MFITLAVTASLLAFPVPDTTTIGTSQAKIIAQEVSLKKTSTPLKVVNLTADEITRAGTQTSVMVPVDAEFHFSKMQVTATAPPPPPEPEPEPVVVVTPEINAREAAPASRSRTTSTPPTANSTTTTTPTASNRNSTTPAPTPAPADTVPTPSVSTEGGSDLRNQIVTASYKYIGTPYGTGPGQMDCSLFTQTVFAEFGISIPRSSSAQGGIGRVVSASEALPGDLVWWSGHVGIYLGDGKHIAARNPSTPLSVSPLYRANPTYIRVVE